MHHFYEVYSEFLSGKKIVAAKRFYIPKNTLVVNRIEYLRERCIGKKVIHIGCLDHPEVILEKRKNQTWLHSIISEVSEYCLGIDNNLHGYEIICKGTEGENIELVNISKPFDDQTLHRLGSIQWDLILCPEVLEHITNHQQVLQNLHDISHHNTTLIITGPNAFRSVNFINTLRGFESVNSDHKYYFTFYTLSRMLAAHGWKPERLIYYNSPSQKRLYLHVLRLLATHISPAFSDGLIMEASRLDMTHFC